METVMESGPPGLQIHLKVLVYHGDRIRISHQLQLVLLDLKTVPVLMPGPGNSVSRSGILTATSLFLNTEVCAGTSHARVTVQGPSLVRSCKPWDDGQEGTLHLHLQEVVCT
jgi:hypothetical protein